MKLEETQKLDNRPAISLSKGLVYYLPHNGHRICQDANINKHVCNTIAKVKFTIVEAVSIHSRCVAIPEQVNRSTNIDPCDYNSHPVSGHEAHTNPECLGNTKDTTVKHHNRKLCERYARGVKIHI